MRIITFVLCLCFTQIISAQIKGTITDDKGTTLPAVSVFIENTYNGTSSNDQGSYELNVKTTGNYTIIFQYLGYKTLKKSVNVSQFPFILRPIVAAIFDELRKFTFVNPSGTVNLFI